MQENFGGTNIWVMMKCPKPTIQYFFLLLKIITKDLGYFCFKSEDPNLVNAIEKMILQNEEASKYI